MVVVLLACPDDHTTGLGRITDGIAQQVGQHPGYFLAVDKELPDFLRIVHFHLYSEFLSLYAIGKGQCLYYGFALLRKKYVGVASFFQKTHDFAAFRRKDVFYL
jgi:hypothetical protein